MVEYRPLDTAEKGMIESLKAGILETAEANGCIDYPSRHAIYSSKDNPCCIGTT